MRKYKLLIVCVFIMGILILGHINVSSSDLPLLGKVIFIDAGHGGRDPGTIYGAIYEKDINLEISKVICEELALNGAIVYMIREDDEDLSSQWDVRKKRGDLYRRIKKIDDVDVRSDVYLSIHINWYDNAFWSGAEVLYHPINSKNKVLGQILMNRFKEDLHSKRYLKQTDLYLYRNTTTPGVLIECGFLSNYNERQLLQDARYQQKIAVSIRKGLIEYFSL